MVDVVNREIQAGNPLSSKVYLAVQETSGAFPLYGFSTRVNSTWFWYLGVVFLNYKRILSQYGRGRDSKKNCRIIILYDTNT